MSAARLVTLVLFAVTFTASQDSQGNPGGQEVTRIQLDYNFAGDDSIWIPRGTLVVSSKDVVTIPWFSLDDSQVSHLKEAAKDPLKLVRIRATVDKDPSYTTYSSIRACALYQSSLSDLISVYFDSNGLFMGTSVTSTNPGCISTVETPAKTFNTTVEVFTTAIGPVPDTQTYLQRLEQEKQEKMRGDKQDNRSFLAKYWIYIVPLVVFMLISGASNPEGEGS